MKNLLRAGAVPLALVLAALLTSASLGGCSLGDAVADRHLGADCDDAARVARAALLTDMLEAYYGAEFPERIAALRRGVELLHQAADAGAGIDAAGDSYSARFVGFAARLLAKRGIDVALGGYDEAVEKLKLLPELVADINAIQATVEIRCAAAPPDPPAGA